MGPPQIEFSIELPPLQDRDHMTLSGRCITDICINASFSMLAIYTYDYDEMAERSRLPVMAATIPIALAVRQIGAYGHAFEKINAGMTAAITASGDAQSLLELWRTKQERSAFILQGPPPTY